MTEQTQETEQDLVADNRGAKDHILVLLRNGAHAREAADLSGRSISFVENVQREMRDALLTDEQRETAAGRRAKAREDQLAGRKRLAATRTQRRCLGAGCGVMFSSWGPGNQMCQACRKKGD